MTARTGLSDLIDELRGLTDTGADDYKLGTANFWDGDHLNVVLDNHRHDIVHELLTPIPYRPSGGSVQYFDYVSRWRNLEQTTGGTSIFIVEDGTGADVGTASYTADYRLGRITFGADTKGTSYYLTARSYDLNAAAADVWRTKAGQAAKVYDVRTDNHGLSRSQIMQHCIEMADYYDSRGVAQVTTLYRSDDFDDYLTAD